MWHNALIVCSSEAILFNEIMHPLDGAVSEIFKTILALYSASIEKIYTSKSDL